MKSPKTPCGICYKNVNVNQKSLLCNKCNSKVHIKCNDISVLEYENLCNDQSNGVPSFCKNCIIDDSALMFPFGGVDNEALSNLFDFDIPSSVVSVPSVEVTSHLRKGDILLTHKNTSQYGLKSIGYAGAKSWTSISLVIKRAPTVISFRRKLKLHFFATTYQS